MSHVIKRIVGISYDCPEASVAVYRFSLRVPRTLGTL